MALALFDLDNTLLGGDSDHAWGDYLCERGILDSATYKQRNIEFHQDYLAGRLDLQAYLAFSLKILADTPREQLLEWHEDYMRDCVEPMIQRKALELLDRHRKAGDTLVIITATNRFITTPIAARLGVDHLLATECEEVDGRMTGRSTDVPCFREGKVTRLKQWMKQTGHVLDGAYFYSDSMNDLPLLLEVEHPVVVDPDPNLHAEAGRRGWPVMSLRN